MLGEGVALGIDGGVPDDGVAGPANGGGEPGDGRPASANPGRELGVGMSKSINRGSGPRPISRRAKSRKRAPLSESGSSSWESDSTRDGGTVPGNGGGVPRAGAAELWDTDGVGVFGGEDV